jgi:hypothetical protein
VSNVVKGLAGRLDKLPADALTGATKGFAAAAEQNGGRIAGRQLTVVVRDRKVAPGVALATFVGTPAGYWVWAEDGIRRHAIAVRRRGGAMAGDLSHPVSVPVIHPGLTPPPLRWTATVRDAERATFVATEDALERAAR